MYSKNSFLTNSKQDSGFTQQELNCMEEEEYFDKNDEEPDQPSTTTTPRKTLKKFVEDNTSIASDENESSSDKDLESALKIKNRMPLKKKKEDEEEKANTFFRKDLKRISSFDKISNRIDINLKINSASEAGDSENESISYNQKRWGSDLESDEDIKEESKIEMQKKIKS